MIDTIHGAKSSAIIYSIVETAKANNLKPFDYVQHLLEEIPKHMNDKDCSFLEDLLPWSEKLPAGSVKLKYRWLQSSRLKMSRYSLFCVYWIHMELILYNSTQPVNGFPHIRSACYDIDFIGGCDIP